MHLPGFALRGGLDAQLWGTVRWTRPLDGRQGGLSASISIGMDLRDMAHPPVARLTLDGMVESKFCTPSSKSSFWFQKTPSQDPLRGSQAHVHHTSHSTAHDTKLTDNAGLCVLQACVKILHARARALKSDSGPRGTGLARSDRRIRHTASHSHTCADAQSSRRNRTAQHKRAASGPHRCPPSAPLRSGPPRSSTCRSAAAALTSIDNLRAEGMNQRLRRTLT